MTKIKCECGKGCDYIASSYERINGLSCNNSRMNDIKLHNEPLICTYKGCKELQGADGEFCIKHYK